MTTEVEQATKTLNDLLDVKDQLIGRSAKLVADRQAISYAAHTGDNKGAKERLRKINDETVLHNAELESIDAAITEANTRLATAQQAEASAADRANAEAVRIKASRMVELAQIIDDAYADVISASVELKELVSEINSLGCASPTHSQLRVWSVIVAKSAVMKIPFCEREWEFLAPNQRRELGSIALGWQQMITTRLGEQSKTTEAA